MKQLYILSLICSILCLVGSILDKDFTESLAWGIVSLNSLKDLISYKK